MQNDDWAADPESTITRWVHAGDSVSSDGFPNGTPTCEQHDCRNVHLVAFSLSERQGCNDSKADVMASETHGC